MSALGVGSRDACPCGGAPGTDGSYGDCCGPLHRQGRLAPTAEALMRSRYSAYALGETDHLWRTWHPRTRPERVTAHDVLTWRGLVVTDVVAGGPDDAQGVVAFEASYDGPDGREVLVERSTFTRRAGRWVYVEASDEASAG